MRILLIEPYYTGSHRQWADGLIAASSHDFELWSMPGQFWRWRLEGSHHHFAERMLDEAPDVDLVLASSMLDLASFLGLARRALVGVPAAVYFHENQITHPPTGRGRHDQSFGLRAIASALAADAVAFNSEFHRRSFIDGADRLLAAQPEQRPDDLLAPLEASTVLPVGVELATGVSRTVLDRPLVVWNHRWDDDKRLDLAVEILSEVMARETVDVALLGERYVDQETRAEPMLRAIRPAVVIDEFAARAKYEQTLAAADVVLSTADHEFFGISIVEGMAAGAVPVVPDRLSYPEIVPTELHETSLFRDPPHAVDLIVEAVRDRTGTAARGEVAARAVERFRWANLSDRYDDWLASITVS